MPYRCPCGSEFDPWDHVCPRCGGALDIEVVRAPVRMTCERGHVAFRETGAHHPCPVCNALLREASPAEPGQDPPAVAEPRARSQESADRRNEILEAEVRLRFVAYAMAVRALVIVGLAWPRILGALVPLDSLGLSSRVVSGDRQDVPLCNAGFLLGLLLLWEARQVILRRAPIRWLIVTVFCTFALHDVLAFVGVAGQDRAVSVLRFWWDGVDHPGLPFPWNIPGMDRGVLREWGWLVHLGIVLLFAADLAVLRALLLSPYGLVFVYGAAEGRLATAGQLTDATDDRTPSGLRTPLVLVLAASGILSILVLL